LDTFFSGFFEAYKVKKKTVTKKRTEPKLLNSISWTLW